MVDAPSHAVDVNVDVDVNEFSHRLICTSWSAWRRSAPEEPCRLPARFSCSRRIEFPRGTAPPMRADNARNSIQSGRRPASREQAYSQQSTTTSTITSTSTSTSMPGGLELYRFISLRRTQPCRPRMSPKGLAACRSQDGLLEALKFIAVSSRSGAVDRECRRWDGSRGHRCRRKWGS